MPFQALQLIQLCVVRLGLLQDGDIRVSVFPQGEEVLIRGAGFRRVALEGIGAGDADVGQHAQGPIADFLANVPT